MSFLLDLDEDNWKKETFIVLRSIFEYTKLFVMTVHERDQTGVETYQ